MDSQHVSQEPATGSLIHVGTAKTHTPANPGTHLFIVQPDIEGRPDHLGPEDVTVIGSDHADSISISGDSNINTVVMAGGGR